MLKILKTRFSQGYRTGKFPKKQPDLPEYFMGLPKIVSSDCGSCTLCLDSCPVTAIKKRGTEIILDMGKCIFCGSCTGICPQNAIVFTKDFSISARDRNELLLNSSADFIKARELEEKRLNLFKKSFNIRVVSAGGCGACEADVNVLNTLSFDLSRFGIHYAASPRHADGMIVTGPVTKNMEAAVIKVYQAMPSPKVVIAAGACAVSGGLFAVSSETKNGIAEILPVDLYIPGCPPNPYTILDGLLRLIDRI